MKLLVHLEIFFCGFVLICILPGTESAWKFIQAVVSQGSILDPFLFLPFINDIVTDIGSNIRLFGDDTSLFMTFENPDIVAENPDTAAELLNLDFEKNIIRAKILLVSFKPKKIVSSYLS